MRNEKLRLILVNLGNFLHQKKRKLKKITKKGDSPSKRYAIWGLFLMLDNFSNFNTFISKKLHTINYHGNCFSFNKIYFKVYS